MHAVDHQPYGLYGTYGTQGTIGIRSPAKRRFPLKIVIRFQVQSPEGVVNFKAYRMQRRISSQGDQKSLGHGHRVHLLNIDFVQVVDFLVASPHPSMIFHDGIFIFDILSKRWPLFGPSKASRSRWNLMAVRCNTSRLKSWRRMQLVVVLSSVCVWNESNIFVTRHCVMCL